MKERLFVSTILILLLLSGCIFDNEKEKEGVIALTKELSVVKEFLAKHPNAKTKILLVEEKQVKENIKNLEYYCREKIKVAPYWNVIIKDGKRGIEVWVEKESKKVTCIIEVGKETTTTSTSTTTTSSTTTSISKNLKVHFIDVGEGDAILLEKEGNYGLIDCGNDYRKIWLYLFKRNISSLEFLIVTNPKAQHLGACDVILENLRVKKVLDNGQKYDIKPYWNYIKLAQKKDHKVVAKGSNLYFNGALLEFLWPPVSSPKGEIEKNSLVIRLRYKLIDFMLMSDCTAECENQLIGNLNSEILKVGFQGSKFSTSSSFLNKVKPEVAIISVGYDNIYGHPSSATLSKLEKVKVHRTDLEGSIVVETNGKEYWVQPEHQPITPTSTIPPLISSTTTSSTTLPTTSSTLITTTSTTTSTSSSTTSSTSTTIIPTTTICQVKCCEDSDCPPDKITKNYTCYGDEIRREYLGYECRYAGSPSATCVGKIKTEFIDACNKESEECLEGEPYCAFTAYGEYHISITPEGADTIYVSNKNFHQYLNFSLKINYVISKRGEVDGLSIYVNESEEAEPRKEYLTDVHGNEIEGMRIGIEKITITQHGITAKLWGKK